MTLLVIIIVIFKEIRGCFRERKSWNGGASLLERGEITEDGSSAGSEVEDSSGSENFGVQRPDLRSINLSREARRCGKLEEEI